MLRRLSAFALATLLLTSCSMVSDNGFVSIDGLKDCDLLFHIAPSDNPITDVTQGIDNQKIDHVAVFFRQDGKPVVVEAVGKGVVITPIDSFLSREGDVVAGIFRKNFDRKRSLRTALSYLGRQYDYLYLPDNTDIYCSELVQISYIYNKGKRVFDPIPMSFHDKTGNITDYWRDFYARQGMDVPEGRDGTNPGEMSRRKIIKIRQLKR